jgi:hypothetical protein
VGGGSMRGEDDADMLHKRGLRYVTATQNEKECWKKQLSVR